MRICAVGSGRSDPENLLPTFLSGENLNVTDWDAEFLRKKPDKFFVCLSVIRRCCNIYFEAPISHFLPQLRPLGVGMNANGDSPDCHGTTITQTAYWVIARQGFLVRPAPSAEGCGATRNDKIIVNSGASIFRAKRGMTRLRRVP